MWEGDVEVVEHLTIDLAELAATEDWLDGLLDDSPVLALGRGGSVLQDRGDLEPTVEEGAERLAGAGVVDARRPLRQDRATPRLRPWQCQ